MLTGDVMLGRGIDQILPHPSEPRLYERYVQSAEDYVRLAEEKNGPIPRGVEASYVWGDAIGASEREGVDLRIINLETAITTAATPACKGINYRMSPCNAQVITAFGTDCCVLANNHVLDWEQDGLVETLATLRELRVSFAGAGVDAAQAEAPGVLVCGRSRVLVFAFATPSSGVPPNWAADPRCPGVNLLPDLHPDRVATVAEHVMASKEQGDCAIASIHWGGNWGYEIPEEQIAFAHGLIDEAGIDIVHGHSSHHPKAIEIWKERLILYGCGDFLNDYEGIGHNRSYRDELVLAYVAEIEEEHGGKLAGLALLPFHIRRFQLKQSAPSEVDWLFDMLSRECGRFGLRVRTDGEKLRLAYF
jgi:poly-gamma-glutamate synthesis protein (capsule biosynthesis protein)